ncbi:MAG: putative YihY family protein [Candidatus Krumholzibacteriota bacterium]|nr:putative YihY family protein [Candidatus Krumholzibacteriota bacterium]
MKNPFPEKPPLDPIEVGKEVGKEATLAAKSAREQFLGLVDAVRRALDGFFERRVPMIAAGLAYYFILGLIPFLFLFAATSGYFVRANPEMLGQINANLIEILPPVVGDKLLSQVENAASNWKAFGLLGLVSLVLVAMGLFDGLDEGINAVMGTRKKIGFFKGRILSLAYILGAILFFSVAAAAGYSLNLLETIPTFQRNPELLQLAGRAFSAWMFALFLFIIYMTLPVKTPSMLHAAVISLGVTGAWTIMQRLGTYLTAGLSRRQALYGALGGAAMFLTWMYFLAFLILLGARILDFWKEAKEKPVGRTGPPGPA